MTTNELNKILSNHEHCSDNESFMHTLESLENDLKRELPSEERTVSLKSIVNSIYGIQTANPAKYRDSKVNHCNTTYMDEFVTENSSCIGNRRSDDNS